MISAGYREHTRVPLLVQNPGDATGRDDNRISTALCGHNVTDAGEQVVC